MTQTATSTPSQVWTRNEVTFMGGLGKDAKLETTKTGKFYLKFSLAVNQGQGKDPMWLDVTAWEKVAEEHAGLKKGDLVEVKGRLAQRKWEGKYYTDVTADEVELIRAKNQEEPAKSAKTDYAAPF